MFREYDIKEYVTAWSIPSMTMKLKPILIKSF